LTIGQIILVFSTFFQIWLTENLATIAFLLVKSPMSHNPETVSLWSLHTHTHTHTHTHYCSKVSYAYRTAFIKKMLVTL